MEQVIRERVPLAPLTTLGIGGTAKQFARFESVRELEALLATDEKILILGGGSNVVVRDAGWDGLVIQPASTNVTRIGLFEDRAIVSAFAGVVWDDFVAQMIGEGLAGLECLSGIPGLVGATPMQNVGAYGQEVADTLGFLRAYDRERHEVVKFPAAECGFAYRTSRFKGSTRWIVLEVRFSLPRRAESMPINYAELATALGIAPGGTAPLAHVRDTVIALRRGKGMVVDANDPESRSAGSFFTNPIVDAATAAEVERRAGTRPPQWPQPDGSHKLAAAWLIERAGFAKGYTTGRVGISHKHALALVNRGDASAAELLGLADTIIAGVQERLGVILVPEPVIV
ncbi:MAG: UDP-N-acetylmuramate dehydrogenase [Kofleriaceae bacterium]